MNTHTTFGAWHKAACSAARLCKGFEMDAKQWQLKDHGYICLARWKQSIYVCMHGCMYASPVDLCLSPGHQHLTVSDQPGRELHMRHSKSSDVLMYSKSTLHSVTLMEPLDIQIRLTRGSVHHPQAIFSEGRLVRGSECMSIQYVYADPCLACCVPHPHTSCEISNTCLVEKHPTDRAYSPGADLRICHLDNGWNLENASEISYDVP